MARPIKNNCLYFPHDANMRNHRKVKAIRKQFVNGYAIWSMLLEYLTDIDGNEFENIEIEYELMAGDFCFPSEEIKEVVNYCMKLNMLFIKNNFIYSESLNEKLSPVYEKRGKAREQSKQQQRKNGKFIVNNNPDNTEFKASIITELTELPISEIPQSKVNEIKVKKTKKNKIEVPPEVLQLRGECKQSFIDYYRFIKNEDFYWAAKDAVAMNSLINKIIFKVKEKTGVDEVPNSETLKAFNLIIKNIQDKWILDNYSLPNINSKFNEIFIQIKNSNNGISNTKQPISKYAN